MPLFAKNKPTKRIDFEGGWVELQYLSKGVKDEIKKRNVELLSGVDLKKLIQFDESKLDQLKDNEVPDEIPLDIIGKKQEIEYYKLSKAIIKWSEEDQISLESIKELDEELFEKILEEVNDMNELSGNERKN